MKSYCGFLLQITTPSQQTRWVHLQIASPWKLMHLIPLI